MRAAAPAEPDHYTVADWIAEAQDTAARLAADAQDLLGDLDRAARAVDPATPVEPATVDVPALVAELKEEATDGDCPGLALAVVWAEICVPGAAACSWTVVIRQLAKKLRDDADAALRAIEGDQGMIASHAADLVRVAGLAVEAARVLATIVRTAEETRQT